jgi:Uncharacterized protein conserved in bacteria
MNTDEQFNLALSNALLFLQRRYPFWSYLVFKARIEASEKVPTAQINALGNITINPAFFLRWPMEMQAFLLAHEIAHVAFGVFWRGKDHDPELCNIAHDYVVNWLLHEDYCEDHNIPLTSPLPTLEDLSVLRRGQSLASTLKKSWVIPGGCFSAEIGPLSYEEAYARLHCDATFRENFGIGRDVDFSPPRMSGSNHQGEETSDGSVQGLGLSGGVKTIDALHDHWRCALASAAEAARMMGRLPAFIERAVNDVLQPRIPWTEKLGRCVKEGTARTKRNLSLPSRRPSPSPFIMGRDVSLGHDVAVAIDTSGSVSQEALKRAVAEAAGVLRATGNSLRFLSCDASVACFETVRSPRDFQLLGGGGTDFAPVFEALKRRPPRVLVYFTDLGGSFPPVPPKYQVIWAVYETAIHCAKPPFGTVIHVPVHAR